MFPERMDQPGLDDAAHRRALGGLARINRWSRVAERLWPYIAELPQEAGPQRLRLLDVASGAGDVAIELGRLAARRGAELEITLLDRSAVALALAREQAERAGIRAGCVQGDALGGPWPEADVIISSLFMHHLDEDGAEEVLGRMARGARRLVVISDLRRSAAGWAWAWAGTRLISRSPIVHHDGPVSVRAAWNVQEVRALAERAGMRGARVERCWPWRWTLSWRPEGR